MSDGSLDALRRVLAGEGATPRRFRAIAARFLSGEVLRLPDELTERLGSDWTFFERYRDAFAEYVGIAGFRLLIDPDYKFAFLVHDEPALRETLDKATSRVAVACRLLYHREQQTVHLTAGVEVTMRDLLERLDIAAGVGAHTPRTKTVEALRTLARYAMVTLATGFAGRYDERFTITPVLPRRLPLTAIQNYLERTHPSRGRAERAGPNAAADPAVDATGNASDLGEVVDASAPAAPDGRPSN